MVSSSRNKHKRRLRDKKWLRRSFLDSNHYKIYLMMTNKSLLELNFLSKTCSQIRNQTGQRLRSSTRLDPRLKPRSVKTWKLNSGLNKLREIMIEETTIMIKAAVVVVIKEAKIIIRKVANIKKKEAKRCNTRRRSSLDPLPRKAEEAKKKKSLR